MKWTGLGAIALAAVVAIGCERNTANDRDDATLRAGDDRSSVGTAGTADHGADDAGADDRLTLGLGGARDSRGFVNEVSMVNHAEIEMAQLASQRAQSPDVKQFAQMMIRDHTKAGNELKQAVSGHDVQMPAHMDDKHQSVMDRLKNLRGAEFDREYMNAMVEGHQDAKNLISSKANDRGATGTTGTSGTQSTRSDNHDQALDTAVSKWATKTLPTVEQHLQRARDIRDKVNNSRD